MTPVTDPGATRDVAQAKALTREAHAPTAVALPPGGCCPSRHR